MKLGYCAITWGGLVAEPSGVGSLKDSYYRSVGDIRDAAAQIGAAGFSGLEVFDGNLSSLEHEAPAVRSAFDTAGVELVSVYTGANFIFADARDEELHKIARAAQLAQVFGAGHLVFGGGARRAGGPRESDFAALGGALDRAAGIAADAGLTSSYHPHMGTLVESPSELAHLMTHTTIGFCPDTGHLAAGGGSPEELIRLYGDRLTHVHLKDFDQATGKFTPLGQGALDFERIIGALRDCGYDGWAMVELDHYEGDPAAAAAISRRKLEHILGSV